MSEAAQDVQAPQQLPRLTGGWRRTVRLVHPVLGTFYLTATQTDHQLSQNPQKSTYVQVPPSGAYQATLHSRGTREGSWSIAGDLTVESQDLLRLLNPENRGLQFTSIEVRQGTEGFSLSNLNGYSLPWESITFTGADKQPISFSINGKCTQLPGPTTPLTKVSRDRPIPSWASGNELVRSWSITYSVQQTPIWANNSDAFPAYYRPGPATWSLSVTTGRQPMSHYAIRLVSAEGFVLTEGILTQINRSSGDRMRSFEYSTTVVDGALNPNRAYDDDIVILDIPLSWPSIWPGVV